MHILDGALHFSTLSAMLSGVFPLEWAGKKRKKAARA
jgi:hypothetical protein